MWLMPPHPHSFFTSRLGIRIITGEHCCEDQWDASEITSTVSVMIFHTYVSSLELLAMTLLRFLRSLSAGSFTCIVFVSYLISSWLQLCLSFFQVHVLTRLFCTLSFLILIKIKPDKMLFIYFLSSATHSSLAPFNKVATFLFSLLFFWISLKTVFLCLLCTHFINYVSFLFFALVLWFLSPQAFTCVPVISSEKEGYTLKTLIISGVLHCLQHCTGHEKQPLIGDDDS